MPVDADIVHRKIALIRKDLERLKKLAVLTYDEFEASFEYEVAAERLLERIIGRMIDINYHLLAAKSISPTDYFESFVLLGREYTVPLELAERMAQASGLRNRLAHEYDDIDPKRIYEALSVCLRDVPEYLKHVLAIEVLKG